MSSSLKLTVLCALLVSFLGGEAMPMPPPTNPMAIWRDCLLLKEELDNLTENLAELPDFLFHVAETTSENPFADDLLLISGILVGTKECFADYIDRQKLLTLSQGELPENISQFSVGVFLEYQLYLKAK